MKRIIWIVGLVAVAGSGYATYSMQNEFRLAPDAKDKAAVGEAVKELHSKMAPVKSGDWLASHHEEGQTFAQYVRSKPVKLTRQRSKLYVQPIGKFEGKKRDVVNLAAEFMGIYFGCEVVINDEIAADTFPDKAKRVHPSWGDKQLLTTHILQQVLRPKLPRDAFAVIAFTEDDLWPGEGWNFVFGQASFRERVGVWSIYRNGDPEEDFPLCLERTIKTATHETGHMFSIEHCIAYRCNMNGSNNRDESDRHPLYLCPECLPKILHATNVKAADRFKKLAEFCKKQKLTEAAEYYEAAFAKVKDLKK